MSDKEPGPVVYIYAALNLIILIARIASVGTALWVAFKPDGSILAGILIFGLSTFLTPESYPMDDEKKGRRR